MSYPSEPIEEGNPYWMCSACHRSDIDISLRGHYEDCSWVEEQLRIKEIDLIKSENEKLKKALEIAKDKLGFYASEDNWMFSSEYGTPSIRTEIKLDHDCHLGCSGKRARQALKEIEEVLK